MEDKLISQMRAKQTPPATPGDVVADLLECNGLSVTQAAVKLGVARVTLSQLVNGHRSLSPEMAHRLGRFFGNGPGFWVQLQQQTDLWQTLHMDVSKFENVEPLAA